MHPLSVPQHLYAALAEWWLMLLRWAPFVTVPCDCITSGLPIS